MNLVRMHLYQFGLDALDFCISSVNAGYLVRQSVRFCSPTLHACDHSYAVRGRIVAVGIGKAALVMVERTIADLLGDHLSMSICCVPEPDNVENLKVNHNCPNNQVFYGPRTNLPNTNILNGSSLIAEVSQSLTADDLLLVCLTGGGSALLTLPKRHGNERLLLDDILQTTRLLSESGANIMELNTVRSCLDELKAGGLAIAAHPAQVVTLIISDVIGDPIEYIASGPTFISPELEPAPRIEQCHRILQNYDLLNRIPISIQVFLETELPPAVRCSNDFHVDNFVIGNNEIALRAVETFLSTSVHAAGSYDLSDQTDVASDKTFAPLILTSTLHGSALQIGQLLANLLWFTGLHLIWIKRSHSKPSVTESPYLEKLKYYESAIMKNCISTEIYQRNLTSICSAVGSGDEFCGISLLLGGETTVKIDPNIQRTSSKKRGGRCSHLALSAAIRWYELRSEYTEEYEVLCKYSEVGLVVGATDGLDGPGAHGGGAWVSLTSPPITINEKEEYDSASTCLATYNSYEYFEIHRSNAIISSKLTNTNVMDILIGLIHVNVNSHD